MALAASLVACASDSTPRPVTIERGAASEVTFDGLHRVADPAYEDVWVKPDVRLGSYSKVLLAPIRISYKRDPKGRTRHSWDGNFALTDEQAQWVVTEMRKAFTRELESSTRFVLTDEPGAGVLWIEAAIIDLIVRVPTRERGTIQQTFSSSLAEMTLVLELHDSTSNEILARAIDRREARAAGPGIGPSQLNLSNAATDADAVRRLFSRWAKVLRRRLDEVHRLEPLEVPPG